MDIVQDLEKHAVRDFAKLWSSGTKAHRVQMLKAQAKFTVVVTIMYVIVVSIYFGAVWNPVQYMSRLEVGVINEDRGNFVGDLIASQLLKLNSSQNITYVSVTPEILNGRTPAQLAEDGDYWAVLHVPQNFTLAMNASVYGGKKPYTNRIYLIFDEGRMQGTVSTVRTITGGIIRGLSTAVASANFAKSARVPINTSTADPTALATPLMVQEVNLHPVTSFGVNFVSFFGNVLVFGATVSSSLPTGKAMKHMKGRVRPWHLLLSRLLHLLFLALLIPVIVALAVTAFGGIPVVSWISYYFFLVLFFFSSSVFICGLLEVIGKPAVGIAGVLLLLGLLASQGFVALEQQHYFYYVGWGTPLFHAVMGSRHLLFGSFQKWFRLNIGVFCCYLFVGLVCMIGRTVYDQVHPPEPQALKKASNNNDKNKDGDSEKADASDEGEMISMDTTTESAEGAERGGGGNDNV